MSEPGPLPTGQEPAPQMPRTARNVAWNALGGASNGVLTVLVTPLFVARLGLDGYGIIGFWLVMQAMLGLLDLGMGAAVVRTLAVTPPGPEGAATKRDLVRTLELGYALVAAVLAVGLALAAEWMAHRWLRASSLPLATVTSAVQLMALSLGLQFPSALYLNGLSGLQAQGRMNAIQVAGNLCRYAGGAAVLWWRADVVGFFAAQAVVAALQSSAARWALWRLIAAPRGEAAVVRLALIARIWRYAAGMALTTVAAVLLANVDRLAVGALLPTAELGKYAVAFTATGLLQLGIQPFYRAFFPRFAELVAAGKAVELREEYFRSCRLMALVIVPLALVGGTFAPALLRGWLGRDDPTISVVFRWLVVGVAGSGLVWLPAAFQQANGWTRLHASMIAGAVVVGAPLLPWAISAFGTVGATLVWVLHGLSSITLELWLMHRRLLVGELGRWFASVLLPPVLWSAPVVALAWWIMPGDLGRWSGLAWAGGTGAVALVLAAVAARGDLGDMRRLAAAPSSSN